MRPQDLPRSAAAVHRKVLALTLVLATLVLPVRAQQAEGDSGPVGWTVYRALDRLPELPRGVSTRMFSSFDRTGGNDDGFQGTFSCLRQTGQGCVIAEDEGAGEIQSLWFTRSGGNVTATGTITIELDGQVVVQEPLHQLVDGGLGAPFTFPLVANADQSSGGVYVKVPMPYRQSMRVTVENNPLFYHVTYRSFSDAEGIETFDAAEAAEDVVELLSAYGRRSPLPETARVGAQTVRDTFILAAGDSAVVAQASGPGQVVELDLHLPQLVRSYGPFSDDGRAHKGYSEFTARLDPNNEGGRLTRRFAGGIGRQKASVEVNGDSVGLWEPLAASPGRWVTQTVELPASKTAGSSTVTVTNRFISSNLDFNEFTYFVESLVDGEYVPTDTIDVGPQSVENEQAHDYRIVGQNWQGARNFFQALEEIEARTPLVLPTDRLLEGLRLQIAFDGEVTVDAPVGEFFGTGLGEYDVRSLFFAVDAESHRFTAWWPMPFAREAEVRLVNTSDVDLEASSLGLSFVQEASYAGGLANGRLGYFHATARRGEPESGRDWVFVDQEGHGKVVGVSHTMHGGRHTGNIRAYLEGDLRVYVDSSRTPQLYGTGTEDFYEGGWYFNRNRFHLPFNGNTAHEDFLGGVWGVQSGDAPADTDGTLGCRYSCDSAYRLLIGDAVPFGLAVRAGMEHGPHNEFPGSYSSTTFWYGHAGTPTLQRTDALDVSDAASVERHDYRDGDNPDAETFISTFEGDLHERAVIRGLQPAEEPVEFRLAVAPEGRTANGPVFLRRLSDQGVGYQRAHVFVDSIDVGQWLQPLSNASHRWLEDGFWLPAEAVTGRDSVTVHLEPADDAPAWQAAGYEAFSYAAGFSLSAEQGERPGRLHLAANFPNPFRDRTVIRYSVPRPMDVELSIYDLHGRLVSVLSRRHAGTGTHRVTWRPKASLASGVYFVTLQAETGHAARTAVRVR